MTTPGVDIFALCQQAFGRIEAGWKDALLAIERHYTPAQIEKAFREAKGAHKKRSLRSPIGYVESVLERLRAEQQKAVNGADGELPPKELCDVCHLPGWLNDMVVRYGLGVHGACAKLVRQDGPSETTRDLTVQAAARLKAEMLAQERYIGCAPQFTAEEEAWFDRMEEARLAELPEREWPWGECPLLQRARAQQYTVTYLASAPELTPAARNVQAHWDRVRGSVPA